MRSEDLREAEKSDWLLLVLIETNRSRVRINAKVPMGPFNKIKVINMETQEEVKEIMESIKNPTSQVGIDPVYVHAVILNRLTKIENMIKEFEKK